jgi:hypothetical protein
MKPITYVVESRGQRFYVPKRDENGKKIPILNDYGQPKPGEFEEHTCTFQKCKELKHGPNGEYYVLSKFTVDETTPKEVAVRLEEKVKEGQCEREEDYIARTNKEQHKAMKDLEKAQTESKAKDDIIAQLEAQVEALKNGGEALRRPGRPKAKE